MAACEPDHVGALVLDLFGTLVAAPSSDERAVALAQIAQAARVPYQTVDDLFAASWSARHDGQLPTIDTLGTYLAGQLGQPESQPDLTRLLLHQAERRLTADASVLACLRQVRELGIRIGLLSDASADLAAAWPGCELAALTDTAVFSCWAGAIKPHRRLYQQVLTTLQTPAAQALYCGDGGGDELRGATASGLRAVRVERRGGPGRLAYGESDWLGPVIARIECLPELLKYSSRGP